MAINKFHTITHETTHNISKNGEVNVVHTGLTESFQDGMTNEIVNIYDNNGNKFYSNFSSIEEANKEIEKLNNKGIKAVVGPSVDANGKVLNDNNIVSVYVSETQNKTL